MVYNPLIPQPTDVPSQSQAQILGNFTLANTYFGQNHVAFDAVANNGKHNFSTYINQGGDPGTGAAEIAMYAKDVGGNSTLFLRKEGNGAVVQISDINPVSNSPGYTWLPGAMLLQWGMAAILPNNTTLINFPIAFTAPAYSVNITSIGAYGALVNPYIDSGSINANSFSVNFVSAAIGQNIFFMAIGPH